MFTFKNLQLKTSVRNLVEFVCASGDLDNRRGKGAASAAAMDAGSKAHRKIQRRQGAEYAAEVPLSITIPCEEYSIVIEGRADGIITTDESVTIDEIKGIYMDLGLLGEPISVHRAQAMCYAYIHALQEELDTIWVQMTYVNLDTEEVKYFKEEFTFDSLQVWFEDIISKFRRWTDFLYEAKKKRKESIKGIEFPFAYREGQRNIAVSVYKTINLETKLFIQAPTGVGKTMSTVFPAVKAIGEDIGDKIFYLTAKTITRTVAEEAFDILRSKGAFFRTVTITAKEKVCMNETCECNPIACPYAKGHFDRVNDAVYDMVTHEDVIDRETIEEYAAKYMVCPFEFTLDATYWVDAVICDFNYVFDPNVYLKRYFSDGVNGDYIFLVDEAHNLVDRAREMYSAQLYKEEFLSARKLVVDKDKRLASALARCNTNMLTLKKECESVMVLDNPGALALSLLTLQEEFSRFFEEKKEFEYSEELAELFFKVRHFNNMMDRLDENYVVYTEHTSDGFMIKLFCVNPAKNLKDCLDKGRSTIFFSATLLPVMYYKELLSSTEDYAIYVRSPFDRGNRLLSIGRDVTSRYTRRNESEFRKIKTYIDAVAKAKTGNYLVFFPSYGYMENVLKLYSVDEIEELGIVSQNRGMKEEEKEEFLGHFLNQDEYSHVGFCVTGGVFSEGIDLKNESLIGCIVIGTGIPQICTERQLLRDFYEQKEGRGYDYAYVYPGMNKVMQAAGRVIRTTEDTGVILLLDDRFTKRDYIRLFPEEWSDYKIIDMNTVSEEVNNFWDGRK